MRSLLILPILLLVGCAKPNWVRMPTFSAPDFSSWFNRENAIQVEQVAQAAVCNTAGGESEVTLLPDLTALNAWASGRGVVLESFNGRPLPASPYAVVEYGQRENSGYGLAVSRQAGLKDSTLLLKGTFFDPTKGRWSSAEPSSVCVFVSLPPREFRTVKVIDQTGAVRAATDGRGS